MPLKCHNLCHIYKLAHVDMTQVNVVNIYASYELKGIKMWQGALAKILLTNIPTTLAMFHWTATAMYKQTPYKHTTKLIKTRKWIFYLPSFCHMCTSNKYVPQMPYICHMWQLLDMPIYMPHMKPLPSMCPEMLYTDYNNDNNNGIAAWLQNLHLAIYGLWFMVY